MHFVRRIGLTGGIGSGKSMVARMLRDLQALVIDVDAISHAVTAAGGPAIEPLKLQFGERCIDSNGAMDRAWMRERVFNDAAARTALEAIVHPLIEKAALAQAADATPHGVVVFEVPLLVESGRWYRRVERVLVVDCDEATQVARVTQRAGWTEPLTRRVMSQQASRATRRAAADAVIDNTTLSPSQLHAHVQTLWRLWAAPAGMAAS